VGDQAKALRECYRVLKTDIVSGLCDIFQGKLDAIILYGSVARGDNDSESDVDIALIVSSVMEDAERGRFFQWNADMDLKYEKVFSIIDINKEILEQWKNVVPFYQNIYDEGVVLWKAA